VRQPRIIPTHMLRTDVIVLRPTTQLCCEFIWISRRGGKAILSGGSDKGEKEINDDYLPDRQRSCLESMEAKCFLK
jgi:hypothetical protein